jgi:hypothetical protein
MILIDDRAGSKELIHYPPLNNPNLSELCRLSKDNTKSADVAFLANGPFGPEMLGIEVKSIDDLVESLFTARLQGMDGQLQQMVDDYSPGFRWLLIYGQYRPSPDYILTADKKPSYSLQVYRDNSHRRDRRSGWFTKKLSAGGDKPVPYGFVEGFLSGPALPSIGFQYHRVNDIEEAAKWVYILYHTWTKEWNQHKALRTMSKVGQINGFKNGDSNRLISANDTSCDSKMDEQFKLRARFANLFTGMGYERSIAVSKYFEGKSIEDMVNAGVSEWAEVEIESKSGSRVVRLGTTIAKSIWQTIRRK